jgi:hypothetical protein
MPNPSLALYYGFPYKYPELSSIFALSKVVK